MYFPEDEDVARCLQYELNCGQSVSNVKENLNPIDSDLELSDPTPSIHDLFVIFNKKFFWGSLGMVEVLWSNRMTKCAGLCYFQGKRGICRISLSAPLLSLRPRKDLVETLLHEMIHAYLFITNNYRDRDDHGPEFQKHMFRINKEAGTNISVYHTFHDEVEYYLRHIWRCNGPCRFKKPYFGFVRRAMNRQPGPNDSWWNQHKLECGGTHIKISEPDKPKRQFIKTKHEKKNTVKSKDIRNLFQCHATKSNLVTFSDPNSNLKGSVQKLNGAAECEKSIKEMSEIMTKHSLGQNKNEKTEKIQAKQDGRIKGDHRIDTEFVDKSSENNTTLVCTGKSDLTISSSSQDMNVRDVVRNIWSKKFLSEVDKTEPVIKKVKITPSSSTEWLSSENEPDTQDRVQGEQQKKICRGGKNEDKITEVKPSCPVCGKNVSSDLMGDHIENCLNCSFTNDKHIEESKDEVTCDSVPCPCCFKWFLEREMNSHIDECLTIIALKEELCN